MKEPEPIAYKKGCPERGSFFIFYVHKQETR